MALTYRTGSGGKGSALTIDELDNNFRHFTGSHSISGSLIISGSTEITGSCNVSGSVEIEGTTIISDSLIVSSSNTFENIGPFRHSGGTAKFDVINGDSYFAAFSGSVRIDDHNELSSGSFQVTGSSNFSPSADTSKVVNIDGGGKHSALFVSGSSRVSGSMHVSGSLIVQPTGSQQRVLFQEAGAIAEGLEFIIRHLPTTQPSTSGQLWLSGSFSNSKYLMVRD